MINDLLVIGGNAYSTYGAGNEIIKNVLSTDLVMTSTFTLTSCFIETPAINQAKSHQITLQINDNNRRIEKIQLRRN